MTDDGYEAFVAGCIEQTHAPLPTPDAPPFSGTFSTFRRDESSPLAVIVSPHPDDECLTGGLPLRLMRETSWRVLNIPVTFGNRQDRRAARAAELHASCSVLGFACEPLCPDGLSRVNPQTRATDAAAWAAMVAELADRLARYKPDLVLLPHATDANATHIGTHWLGMDALANLGAAWSCTLAFTEYWQPNEKANLLLGLSTEDAALLLKALCCHVGEVARNPYHRRFPAFLMDTVRRGSEIAGGNGSTIAPFDLGLCYQTGRWTRGAFQPFPPRILPPQARAADIVSG